MNISDLNKMNKKKLLQTARELFRRVKETEVPEVTEEPTESVVLSTNVKCNGEYYEKGTEIKSNHKHYEYLKEYNIK